MVKFWSDDWLGTNEPLFCLALITLDSHHLDVVVTDFTKDNCDWD